VPTPTRRRQRRVDAIAPFTVVFGEVQKTLTALSHSLSDLTASSLALGADREWFVREVLQRFLPSGVQVETGIAVSSVGQESSPQDVILLRNDYPVATGLLGLRRFVIESVLACAEVKSNLDKKTWSDAMLTLRSIPTKRFEFATPGLSPVLAVPGVRIDLPPVYIPYYVSVRRYVFSYLGPARISTALGWLQQQTLASRSLFDLPAGVCWLAPEPHCLLRDDGQLVLPPHPSNPGKQCLYLDMLPGRRALEYLVMHVLSTCLLVDPLRLAAAPLVFHSPFEYIEKDVCANPAWFDVPKDFASQKVQWAPWSADDKEPERYLLRMNWPMPHLVPEAGQQSADSG